MPEAPTAVRRHRRARKKMAIRRHRLALALAVIALATGGALIFGGGGGAAGPKLLPDRARIGPVALATGQLGYRTDPQNTYCNRFSAYWRVGADDCHNENRDEESCADFSRPAVLAESRRPLVYGFGADDINAGSVSFYRSGRRAPHMAPRRVRLRPATGGHRRLRPRRGRIRGPARRRRRWLLAREGTGRRERRWRPDRLQCGGVGDGPVQGGHHGQRGSACRLRRSAFTQAAQTGQVVATLGRPGEHLEAETVRKRLRSRRRDVSRSPTHLADLTPARAAMKQEIGAAVLSDACAATPARARRISISSSSGAVVPSSEANYWSQSFIVKATSLSVAAEFHERQHQPLCLAGASRHRPATSLILRAMDLEAASNSWYGSSTGP